MAVPSPDDRGRRKRRPRPARASEPPAFGEADAEAERAYIESLIATKQAAKPDPRGVLGPGATHEPIEEDGKLRVIRRRFSAY
jgi:hypothetical protein